MEREADTKKAGTKVGMRKEEGEGDIERLKQKRKKKNQ